MLTTRQRQQNKELGIPEGYGFGGTPPCFAEAKILVDVGPNLVGRMQQLVPEAAAKWMQMVEKAQKNNIVLLVVSGFRSFDYQAGLIRKKLEAGQAMESILTVNAAPGYSQHHTGRAVDVASPGTRPLTEEFENSDAFKWLTEHAADFGFDMPYTRDNEYGFVYEPWHWALREGAGS